MTKYSDSDLPTAFLPYWRKALDGDPVRANSLMGQLISDLAQVIIDSEGSKKLDRQK